MLPRSTLFKTQAWQAPPYHGIGLLRHQYLRSFSTTSRLSDSSPPNHYEVLGLNPSASPGEIKKQFYKLSKTTHPDANPNDPSASARFSQISESYSIIADPERRRRYDRDHLPRQHASSSPGPSHAGSYAGSRPASGLSRRRGAFRGPPPSFYAQGAPRRSPRPDPSSSSSSSADNSHTSSNHNPSSNPGGGFGPSGPTSSSSTDVPHFNRDATLRTQSSEDARRQTRRASADQLAQAAFQEDRSFWVRFVIVSSIIVGTTVAGTVFAARREEREGQVARTMGKRREVEERMR